MHTMNDPMNNAIHDAREARQDGRGRIVQALRGQGGPYAAQQAHRAAQDAIAHHRQRALTGARAVATNETNRLFWNTPLYVHQDPAREHDVKVRVQAITDTLDNEQAAQAAMNRLLRAAHIGDNLALAGGVAAHALQKGWDSIVAAWVSSPQLGGARGGWATVERIKTAQALLAGDLPPVLQELPPLSEMAEGWGMKHRMGA